MITVKHRFLNHQISPDTETLIIGTFNPETPDNTAEFFYGRSRNFLWRLLPTAFDEPDLKPASREEKLDFIKKYKLDLIDLIQEIIVEDGQEANYYDGYIDSRVKVWTSVLAELDQLSYLKRVCFTRKTYIDIPCMKKQVDEIKSYCEARGILFKALITPARFYREDKQAEWSEFLTGTK